MEIFAYNDNNYYVNFSNNTLGLSGGNANMTGHLTVNGTQDAVHINADTWGSLILQNSNVDVSTTPESNQYMGIDFRDKNNTRVGFIGAKIGSDGNNYLEIQQQGVGGLNFPKCTTRATTTSTAKSWLPAVVVQNYVNGTSWYRVYSDGWIEQGGQSGTIGTDSQATITFPKAFTGANVLSLSVVPLFKTATAGNKRAYWWVGSLTKTNFILYNNNESYSGAFKWVAWGH